MHQNGKWAASLFSIGKHNITRIHIQHVDIHLVRQHGQDIPHFGPSRAKLLLFFMKPIVRCLRRKFRRPIQISAGEIQQKWRRDNGHFDYPQFVILCEELRNMVTANLGYIAFTQPVVTITRAAVWGMIGTPYVP